MWCSSLGQEDGPAPPGSGQRPHGAVETASGPCPPCEARPQGVHPAGCVSGPSSPARPALHTPVCVRPTCVHCSPRETAPAPAAAVSPAAAAPDTAALMAFVFFVTVFAGLKNGPSLAGARLPSLRPRATSGLITLPSSPRGRPSAEPGALGWSPAGAPLAPESPGAWAAAPVCPLGRGCLRQPPGRWLCRPACGALPAPLLLDWPCVWLDPEVGAEAAGPAPPVDGAAPLSAPGAAETPQAFPSLHLSSVACFVL